MKKAINIFLNIVKQTFGSNELDSTDFDKLNLIVTILELEKNVTVEKIGHGTYVNVYKIGNKVLKVGLAKIEERIIKHPSIINIYLKTNILMTLKNRPIKVGIEIQEFAEVSFPNESELYNLYKELRNDGIIWNDVKASNTGYSNKQLVVIDTDFLYFTNEIPNYSNYLTNLDKEFDKLYNENREDYYEC